MRKLLYLLVLAQVVCWSQPSRSSPPFSFVDTAANIVAKACRVGQAPSFATDAVAGSNLYVCTSTNVWTQVNVAGGGPPSGAAGGALSGTYPNPPLLNFMGGPFVSIAANPIISPTGGETLTSFGSFLKDGSTYHAYYHYNISGLGQVGHATSTDGITWTKDAANNPVLAPSTSGNWDDSQVGVPYVWKEGSTWNMLYRGQRADNISHGGFATSTDGIAWTRWVGNNCVAPSNVGNGCVLDVGLTSITTGSVEFFGVIKVGSTYYASIDQPGGATRAAGVATSTDLHTWTKDDANNPTFSSGRYCAAIIKYGNFYYEFINHYIGGLTQNSEIELYRSATPTFYPAARTYLGIVKRQSGPGATVGTALWDSFALDTPFILTDDITRSTFALTNGDLWMYYSGTATVAHTNFYTGLAISAGGAIPSGVEIGLFPSGITVNGMVSASSDVKAGGSNGFWLTNPAAFMFWQGRSQLSSPADGNLLLQNTAGTSFGNLQFGGTTSSFPSLKRSSTTVQSRLADDSADAPFSAAAITASGQVSSAFNSAASTPSATLTGTWFTGGSATTTKPHFLIETAGATSTAWSTFGTALGVNSASGYTGYLFDFQANGTSRFSLTASGVATFGSGLTLTTGNLTVSAGALVVYTGRSKFGSDADSTFTLYNNALNNFNRLNFGGITSSFPSWQRSTTKLIARLADDSADTDIEVRSVVHGGTVPGISGCSAGTQTGGNTAGTYSSGTTGTCTVVLTFALTAPTGWACFGSDRTTPADLQTQTASTTTTATLSGTTISGDVISFGCMAY